MRRARAILVALLIVLFAGFSFNAYACLLPFVGHPATTMGAGCSTSGQQPTPQFCEAFKTLTVETGQTLDPAGDAHRLCPGGAVPAVSCAKPASGCAHLLVRTLHDPPRNLPLNAVLRI
ncbi:MAG: hypothetical protein AB1555_00105 [Nitrospirota bacterium]